jgi:hypothetical protein
MVERRLAIDEDTVLGHVVVQSTDATMRETFPPVAADIIFSFLRSRCLDEPSEIII